MQVANATSFITYALQYENKTSDMALTDMYDYKNPRRPERIRNDASVRIASLLYSALHSPEKRQQIGGPFTVVTFVPSSDDAGFSALSQVVERALRKIKHSPPVTSTLAWTPNRERVKRKFDAEKYTVLDPDLVRGERVLLIEDTWVSGANAQSAAAALHQAEASWVTILTVARMLDEHDSRGEYLRTRYRGFPPPSLSQ